MVVVWAATETPPEEQQSVLWVLSVSDAGVDSLKGTALVP